MALQPGGWRNFDDIEDALSIEELLLLTSMSEKVRREEFRFHASIQGIDLGDDEPLDMTELDGELPEEVLMAEREWARKRDEAINNGAAEKEKLSTFDIGYIKQ